MGDTNVFIRLLSSFLNLAESPEQKELDFSGLSLFSLPSWYISSLASVPWLNYLNLSQNQITELPRIIGDIISLETLDISNNLLDFLPTTLTRIPNLKKVKIKGNILSCLPKTALKNTKSLLSYLSSLEERTTQWHRIKILFVGPENVGKTVSKYYNYYSNSPWENDYTL